VGADVVVVDIAGEQRQRKCRGRGQAMGCNPAAEDEGS
jgi:hypothetical protein